MEYILDSIDLVFVGCSHSNMRVNLFLVVHRQEQKLYGQTLVPEFYATQVP